MKCSRIYIDELLPAGKLTIVIIIIIIIIIIILVALKFFWHYFDASKNWPIQSFKMKAQKHFLYLFHYINPFESVNLNIFLFDVEQLKPP